MSYSIFVPAMFVTAYPSVQCDCSILPLPHRPPSTLSYVVTYARPFAKSLEWEEVRQGGGREITEWQEVSGRRTGDRQGGVRSLAECDYAGLERKLVRQWLH